MRFPVRAAFAAPLALFACLAAASAACGDDDDDEGCKGTILNSCTDCSCDANETTTCTAWPRGDTDSAERCCECGG